MRLIWLVPPVALGPAVRRRSGAAHGSGFTLILAGRAAFASPGRPRGIQGGAAAPAAAGRLHRALNLAGAVAARREGLVWGAGVWCGTCLLLRVWTVRDCLVAWRAPSCNLPWQQSRLVEQQAAERAAAACCVLMRLGYCCSLATPPAACRRQPRRCRQQT